MPTYNPLNHTMIPDIPGYNPYNHTIMPAYNQAMQKGVGSQPLSDIAQKKADSGRKEDDKPFSITGDRLADQFLFLNPHY